MSDRDAEIYCLLVPLVDERLIIPRSCVAEVISYQAPAEMTGAPPWYLGVVNWNGRHVPLVSFEGCCGENIPPASSRSRVVILHAVSPRVETGYFALVSQGFPQLVRASRELLKPDSTRVFPERSPVLCQLHLLNEAPLVPDLVRLEAMVAEETTILPP
jgi:chemosensory pili system protein ChpC